MIIIVRWDPKREDSLLFQQSVLLYATYYHLQILIHRPFIPSPRKPSPLSFPSLAICTNAARSCSHVAEVMRKRDLGPAPWVMVRILPLPTAPLLNGDLDGRIHVRYRTAPEHLGREAIRSIHRYTKGDVRSTQVYGDSAIV